MISSQGNLIFVIIVSAVSLVLGAFIFLKPLETFKIQKKFYEFINWRIEPISMAKEIRNTRIMGLGLLVFVIGLWLYLLVRS